MKSVYFIVIVCLALFMGATSCSSDDFDGYDPVEEVTKPEIREVIRTIKSVDGTLPATRGVAVTNKLWGIGDTIRIKFLNGGSDIQDTVKKYADIWLQYANLVFEYVNANEYADVKIGFNMDDRSITWSTIGTDCRQIPQNGPSLNFVNLQNQAAKKKQGEVLRGFGHILGLGFEHQNPTSAINFSNMARIYFSMFVGLSDNDIDNHILPYYTTNQTNYTQYDRNSIMVLEIPSTILSDQSAYTPPNYDLSTTDIAFISNLYPYPSIPGVLINGVYWATCNIDSPGRFAATPESPGRFYQWNRKRAWLNDFTDWVFDIPTGDSWEAANDPSPAGWRVPDTVDFNKLLDTTKVAHIPTIQNKVNGLTFMDKASGNAIFLPFAGMLYPYTTLFRAGTFGYYWSTIPDSGEPNSYRDAWAFGCASDGGYVGVGFRYSSMSIRCVR